MVCLARLALGSLTVWALAGCGGAHEQVGASQVAARVNQVEITDLELDSELARAPAISAESANPGSRQVLMQLIDQELMAEKALAASIDHTPAVLEEMQAAKRRVLASAWLHTVEASVTPPTDQDIAAYYSQHADFFSSRRVFIYEIMSVPSSEAKRVSATSLVKNPINFESLCDYLKAYSEGCDVQHEIRGTEELSAEIVTPLRQLRPGEAIALPDGAGLRIVHLLSDRLVPVDTAHARPFIERFLLAQKRKQRVDTEIAVLRGGASIYYAAPYAAMNR